MTLLQELLNEATKPTKVAEPKPKLDTEDMFQDNFQSPAKSRDTSVQGKARQGSKLRDAIAQHSGNAPAMNMDAINSLPDNGDDDVASTSVNEPEPKTPGTELATKSNDVRAAGKAKADWMGVDQLPGYMQTGIRRMGRIVFAPLTKTKLQDISILANLGGHGPSSQMELNAVASFAMKNARETRDLSMQFGEMIPGYEPEAKLYVTTHDTYLVVQDEMGQYIYSWESKDTKDAFLKSIDGESSTKELE